MRTLQTTTHDLAERGLRLLAVATAETDEAFPEEPLDAPFRFQGLIGFFDPVRAEVPAAVREAHGAGHRPRRRPRHLRRSAHRRRAGRPDAVRTRR
jgi:magnesium-transporting ATPase (P-type)